MRVGILGGTFDPVHKGHLHLAKSAVAKLKLNKVIFIPAYIPPHKRAKAITATAADRLKMARLAVSGNRKFTVSDYEIKARAMSYTIRTLRHFRRTLGRQTELFFLTGADSVSELTTWRQIDKIFRLARFVIATRPGFSGKDAPEEAIYLKIRPCAVSSTSIRRRIKRGLSIKRYVPARVHEYIAEKKLYRRIKK